ncbi:MAG: aminopeptidase [Waddliaceae bacterium]
MRDFRLDKWAELLVAYSLEVESGQRVLIQADIEALPLVEACYEKCVQFGAHPELLLNHDRLNEYFLKNASDVQLLHPPQLKQYAVEQFDRFLFIYAPGNTQAATNVPLERHTLASKATQSIMKMILDRKARGDIRWCRTHFPNAGAAQTALMGTTEFEDFVFHAGFLHHEHPIESWQALGKAQQKAVDYFSDKKELHFKNSNGTDLYVNISGMKWANLCGTINFPDGEIYTGPNLNAPDGGVNGIVKYDFPTIYRSVEVDGIELIFENGAVKEAKASRNEDFLRRMIEQDEGAKYVGEIAIGTNFCVTTGVRDILFDEKIGGSFHTALGMGYPETGNKNQSALHWDLICDLRDDGVIYADNEKVFENGKFLFDDWPSKTLCEGLA